MDLFYGRSHEAASLSALVTENRVVFVYGPAGVGKSALVRVALAESSPPLLVVSLAGAEDPRSALARIARAMGARPPAVEDDDLEKALAAMLRESPRTLVLDDVTDTSLAPMVAYAAKQEEESRFVLVARRFFTSREAGLRAAAFEVKPLDREEAVALVHALEKARGRTLAEDLADSTGGNPLLLQLALATPRAALAEDGDAESALRRSIEAIDDAAGRTIIAALAAAGTALDETELAKAAGSGAAAAIDTLRKRLVVTRGDGRLSLAPSTANIVHDVLGAAKPATWKIVQRVADRMLASVAHDDGALIAAARARIELDDAAAALEIVRTHHLARASADPVALERLLRDLGARDAEQRSQALLVLAREALRAGDYDAARRALDDLPRPKTYEEAERAALLRAECHIRAGEPAAAQRAIDALPAKAAKKDKATPSPALILTRAQLAILRGELESARKTLEALAPHTKDVPPLEARRAVQVAASYLYEERYDKAHSWVERARAASKAAGLRVEPVATILDVHALLGLGEISRAEEVVAREASGRPHGPMLEAALLVHRGEHARALAGGDAALASLDRRADLLFRSVVARDLARAAIATSAFARAAKFIRLAEAGADEPGLAALRPICDAEEARLAEARGDRTRARRAIDRAFEVIPRSPFVAVDHATIHGEAPSARDDEPPAAFAYAALRSAELDVANGKVDTAIAAAERAERFYTDAGMRYEAARAALVLGEALARQPKITASRAKKTGAKQKSKASHENGAGRIDEAERALAACEALANANDYPFLAASAALVRAHVADGRGDVSAASIALEDAVRIASNANIVDAAIARAARRLGVTVSMPRGDASAPRPFEPLVERLGLARPADILWRVGDRTFLRAKADGPPAPVSCTVDVDDRKVEVLGGDSISLPEQRIALLVALAESGGTGATLEELFALVWRGAFHPLRHRNAVYVALTRLKDSLKPFIREVRLAHDGERYRLVGNAPVAVRRQVSPNEIASLVRDGAGPMVHDHDD